MSSGSSSDPHRLALLRAIRLRQAAPDAVAAGAADTDAALSDKSKLSGTGTAESTGTPASGQSSPTLPPDLSRLSLASAPAANSDPFAQTLDAEVQALDGGGVAGPATGRSPGDPIPGAHPEAPNPALLAAALRALSSAGAASAGTGTSADGMNPADDAELREMQRVLGDSLALAGGSGEVAGRLWVALAQAQPELLAALPGGPQTQREQLDQALNWLVRHLDQPPELVAGCGLLGAALAECGVRPPQLLVGAALAEAMRAGMPAGGWRQEFDQAWRTTWHHAYEWIVQGAKRILDRPTTWTATVVAHERRRDDLAIVRLRPDLPMPFRPGQYARIEVAELPGVRRPYSLAGAPRRDDVVELHVRAKTESGVSGTLVYRTKVGDTARISRAEGAMTLLEHSDRNLLMIAGDTGVAPLKALLTELAATGDPRSAVLFWGVRTLDELYDIDEVAQIARDCRRATVVPVISEGAAGRYASGLVTDAVAAYGEWSDHEVYLAGPPIMLAATSAALGQLGVRAGRIHHDPPE